MINVNTKGKRKKNQIKTLIITAKNIRIYIYKKNGYYFVEKSKKKKSNKKICEMITRRVL